jgi:exopolysaccharide biosynthesis polyprenyl glycosylphosphotransferase
VNPSYRSSPGWAARHILLASDVVSLASSLFVAWRLVPVLRPLFHAPPHPPEPFGAHVWLLGWIIPLWLLLGQRYGLYLRTPLSWGSFLGRVVKVQALGLGAMGVLIFALKLQTVSRLILFGFAALYVPVSLVVRAAAAGALEAHRSHIYNIPRILVVGTGASAREFLRRGRRKEGAYCQMVGCLEADAAQGISEVEGVPVVGTTEIFEKYIFSNAVDVVVFAVPVENAPRAAEMTEAAMSLGLRVAILPRYGLEKLGFGLDHPEVSIEPFLGQPVAVLTNLRPSLAYRAAKRVLDIAVSAVALVALSPLLLLIAALVRLTSPGGPIFYPWNVLGTNLKPFRGYKFRTMVPNADALKSELHKKNEMRGPVFKMRNDPRVTPFGRALRKFSLDELPQLWSVLKGDMSLVGPRPAGRDEARRYEFWQRRKLSVKPGITCLWQINGRNEIDCFDDWARMDLEYVQKASLWLDCKILLKTVPAVLSGRGAS